MTDTKPDDRSAPQGFNWVISDGLAMTKRYLLRNLRTPQYVVFSTIQPIMFVLLFVYVFGGAIGDVPGGSYTNFIIPGIMVQTSVFGATNTAIGIADDLQRGMVERFRSLPMARSAVLVGRTLADGIRNLFVTTLIIVVGYIIGFRFKGNILESLGAVLVAVLFGYALSWVFAFVGVKSGDVETAQASGFVWVFPLVFASSAFVPTSSMPSWLGAFADNQPVTKVVDATRALALGFPAGDALRSALIWIALIIAVFSWLTVRAYRNAS